MNLDGARYLISELMEIILKINNEGADLIV